MSRPEEFHPRPLAEPDVNLSAHPAPIIRPMTQLPATVDWFSRRVLAWRVSISMGVDFCLDALDGALARHGRPEIFNTDQGSQFTSAAFTGVLSGNVIRISMDGRGSWRDNVFVERLWRTVKYEEVYLRAYDSVAEARGSIGGYLAFYNRKRPHSRLNGQTPDQAYLGGLALAEAARCSPPWWGHCSSRATPSLRTPHHGNRWR